MQASQSARGGGGRSTTVELNQYLGVVVVSATHVSENWECAICLELFKVNQRASVVRCGHRFHKMCIIGWLKLESTCPLCRTNIKRLWSNRVRTQEQRSTRPELPGRGQQTGPRASARGQQTGPRASARGQQTGPRASARGQHTAPRAQTSGQQTGPRPSARGLPTGPRASARGQETGPRASARGQQTGPRASARGQQTGPRAQTSGQQTGPGPSARGLQTGPRAPANGQQAGPRPLVRGQLTVPRFPARGQQADFTSHSARFSPYVPRNNPQGNLLQGVLPQENYHQDDFSQGDILQGLLSQGSPAQDVLNLFLQPQHLSIPSLFLQGQIMPPFPVLEGFNLQDLILMFENMIQPPH